MKLTKKLKKIVFLVGPTASGKTDIAINLAKKLNAEIISCDSMQIYKGMDILASKPPLPLLKKVKHHLLSIKSPSKEFNVAEYFKLALQKIKSIHRKGKIPLFVGGTGLYMNVVLDGIFPEAGANRRLRDRLYAYAKKYGNVKIYERLQKVDPQAAAKIHPNDLRRIVRALEVYEKTGKPISEWHKQRRGIWGHYDIRIFGIKRAKALLVKRINSRVDEMFDLGLVNEVKKLLKNKLSRTASFAIGIREIKGYLDRNYDLEEAKRRMRHNTWAYAKRQMTWFRKEKRICWLRVAQAESPKKIAGVIYKRLRAAARGECTYGTAGYRA
ncbi:MAG: tRNA (adenosine(37)-N6)-dimethylallyltransferase MiaA [Candidatus Omnitrophica bacterium]|nr:tRNA (adenosine(37)-N6)-dimethylallyltransferase MiaA [Candidatus Omnitrophota bacterium]